MHRARRNARNSTFHHRPLRGFRPARTMVGKRCDTKMKMQRENARIHSIIDRVWKAGPKVWKSLKRESDARNGAENFSFTCGRLPGPLLRAPGLRLDMRFDWTCQAPTRSTGPGSRHATQPNNEHLGKASGNTQKTPGKTSCAARKSRAFTASGQPDVQNTDGAGGL